MSDTQWTPKQRDHVHQFVLDKVLRSIIEGTTEAVFDQAGGFTYTDEIAAGLNARWREARYSDVVQVAVSATDLAWLLDGYARSRLTQLNPKA